MNSIYFLLEVLGAQNNGNIFTYCLPKSKYVLSIPSGYSEEYVVCYLGFQTFNSKFLKKEIRKEIGLLNKELIELLNKTTLLP